jgi:hypothetical protein
MKHAQNCDRKWGTRRLVRHQGRLRKELKMYPFDGSIELELSECVSLLQTRRKAS